MTRLQSLRNRREILIQANSVNMYVTAGHPKSEKYYKVLLAIRKEINAIECVNVHPVKVGMTVSDLFRMDEKNRAKNPNEIEVKNYTIVKQNKNG